MAEKPIPSQDALDRMAAAWWQTNRDDWTPNAGGPQLPEWADLPQVNHFNLKAALVPILVAAYPQIVADVLNHYADTAEARTDRAKHWTGDVSQWLRAQAVEVLS